MKVEIRGFIINNLLTVMLVLCFVMSLSIIFLSKSALKKEFSSKSVVAIKNSYANTDGAESKYYINTPQDLWDFAEEVNSGNTFEGVTVYLTTNINLQCDENNQWIPIGKCYVEGGNIADKTTEKDPFGGIFEGNNHTISGVYIDSESNYVGLFGYNQGTIRNLKLKDSYIKSNKAYIGGIAGFNKGTIQNCHNYANIVTDVLAGACGGIAGYSTGANILDCSNKGEIESGNGGIGGITGYAFLTKIENCYNEGNLDTISGTVGGMVGICSSSWLRNNYNLREYRRKCVYRRDYWKYTYIWEYLKLL